MARFFSVVLLFLLAGSCLVLAEKDPSFEQFKTATKAQLNDMNMRIAKVTITASRNEFYVQKIQADLEKRYQMLSKKIKDASNSTEKATKTQSFRDILCEGFPEKFGERIIAATDPEKKAEEILDIIEENIYCDQINLEFIRDTALLISQFDIPSVRMKYLGDRYETNDRYLEAIILFYAGAMHSDFIGDDGADDVENAIVYINSVVDDAVGTGKGVAMVKSFALPLAKELLEELKKIKHVSDSFRSRAIANSYISIGGMYLDIEEYEKQLEMDEKAIVTMTDQFGDEANQYKIFGFAWNNACVALGHLGKYERAIEKCSKALLIYQEVTDWTYDSQKQTEIERTESNIKIYRGKLEEEKEE